MHLFNPGGYMSPQHYPETHSQTSSIVALQALTSPPKGRPSKRRGILKKRAPWPHPRYLHLLMSLHSVSRPFQKRHQNSGPTTLGEGEARALVYNTGALSRYPDVGPAHTGVVLPVQSTLKGDGAGQHQRGGSSLAYDCESTSSWKRSYHLTRLLQHLPHGTRSHEPLCFISWIRPGYP